ncbi:MAG TPA: hypothetical protein VG937_24490 [Polyangiaceae bacterium]|nr:hypothetical protein [Polyangiaceae bacterium]
MRQSLRARFALTSLVGNALVFVGCATGQAWVREPEDAFSSAASPELAQLTASEGPPPSVAYTAVPNLPEPDGVSRRRLDHVVSLGEGASAAPAQPGDAATSASPTVVINIVNTTAPSPGSANYGYGYPARYGDQVPRFTSSRAPAAGVSRVAPTRAGASAGTPPVGHDWPASPSYGPNFPYHTGPASPWERTR